MSNDDSDPEVEESTKQVDRDLLQQALNQSVESNDVLKRVNALVNNEVHAEGTAQVDRDSVQRYLEAARSGEFPAAVRTSTPTPVRGTTADEDSDADFLPNSGNDDSVFSSRERDLTGPKAAIFNRSPSRTSVPPASFGSEEAQHAMAGRAADSDATILESGFGGDEGPPDFSEFQKEAPVAPLAESGEQPAIAPKNGGTRLLVWFLVLAIAGALLGVIFAAVWLVMGAS